ncbi:DUF3667 domain-containing protein [Robertkochia marina]|uniref:DUF3667 domain-containing protein n=1 Tax=Robertkochia marina TaxID=1227945 RepID=A0A4S3LZY6_9FLAO|nr:DUF3667 domain-containing protein [Robertkochia marina]THD66307.1 DUF3667 domain-containing protein [Robertkochia marina]TRZ41227.1 DUF3667 domain-containing protein [Robertkochia marina]
MSDKPVKKGGYLPERRKFKYRGNCCLNCDHPLDLSDKYCANCGQINSMKKFSVQDLFDELFGTLFNYDSKLRQTLSALLLKPGKITREYINGKRASYTNPFQTLLSLCIIYFLLLGYSSDFESLNQKKADADTKGLVNIEEYTKIADSLKAEQLIIPKGDVSQEALQDSLKATIDTLKFGIGVLEALDKRKDSLATYAPQTFYNEVKNDTSGSVGRFISMTEFFYRTIKHNHYNTPEEARSKLNIPLKGSELWAFRTGKSINRVTKEPGTFLNTVISRLPFFIFFFLPVFTVFIWLLYLRREFNYMDHLIFSFHSQSLFIILLIIAYIIYAITDWNVLWVAVLLFSFYLYRAMRVFYQQGRLKTILKFSILNTIFVFLASISMILFLSGSALTY